jgi:hypothetical protein
MDYFMSIDLGRVQYRVVEAKLAVGPLYSHSIVLPPSSSSSITVLWFCKIL